MHRVAVVVVVVGWGKAIPAAQFLDERSCGRELR